MRFAPRAPFLVTMLLSGASACNSKPERDLSRFIVEIETVGGVTVTVAGRAVPLEPTKLDPSRAEGMIDFKESEVSSKTRPEITIHTPCGPKPVELKPGALSPPDESNVVRLKLSSNDLPTSTAFVFAPGVKGPVTIGDITVPTPIPRELTVYDAACGKPITVGTTTSPIEGGSNAMLVAPSTSACLKSGVALYGSGSSCKRESSQRLMGKLVYPLAERPQIQFAPMDNSIKLSGADCLNRSWVQEC